MLIVRRQIHYFVESIFTQKPLHLGSWRALEKNHTQLEPLHLTGGPKEEEERNRILLLCSCNTIILVGQIMIQFYRQTNGPNLFPFFGVFTRVICAVRLCPYTLNRQNILATVPNNTECECV